MTASRRRVPAILAAILATLALAPAHAADQLEIASWWTSRSEAPALQLLIDRFHATDPAIAVDNAAVQGGAGSNVQIVLARRLEQGDPPDIWQTFLGTSLDTYARNDDLSDLGTLFQRTGLGATIPPAIRDAATWRGRQWGVPTGAHRSNMLWFDPAVLHGAGIDPPAGDLTLDAFLADLQTLKAHGVAPLCLGAADRFTTVELFEDVLLGIVGAKGWSDIAADRFDWSGSEIHTALAQLDRILAYAGPDAQNLGWTQAAQRLATGKCAFLAMNDSLYGELVADGVAPDAIGATPWPGTAGQFVAILDTFVVAAHSAHREAADAFLATVASAPTELAFARIKGSAPLRSDVDLASLSAYQRSAYQAMTTGTILLSVAHGEILGSRLEQAIYDGIAAFARSHDPHDFIERIDQAQERMVPQGF